MAKTVAPNLKAHLERITLGYRAFADASAKSLGHTIEAAEDYARLVRKAAHDFRNHPLEQGSEDRKLAADELLMLAETVDTLLQAMMSRNEQDAASVLRCEEAVTSMSKANLRAGKALVIALDRSSEEELRN